MLKKIRLFLTFTIFLAFLLLPLETITLYLLFALLIVVNYKAFFQLKFIFKNIYTIQWFLLIGCWLYGLIIGFINGNETTYIIKNFAGMAVYSLFVILYYYKPEILVIKKILFFSSVFSTLFTIIMWVTKHILNATYIIDSIPIINNYSNGVGVNILYSTQILIFISLGICIYDIITCQRKKEFNKQMFCKLLIILLNSIAILICVKQGGFLLAYIMTILISVFFAVKERFKLTRNQIKVFIGSMVCLILLFLLFSFFTNGIVYKIFNPEDIGNSRRMEQIRLVFEESRFFGYGLGATFRNDILVTKVAPYGIEVVFINVIHKFGIFSLFIFFSYLLVYFKTLFQDSNHRTNLYAILCLSFLFPALGNPYLFHPLSILLHCFSLYLIDAQIEF